MSTDAFIGAQSLSALLARELSELRRFCALLAEERQVLSGALADRLPDIAVEKSSLAAILHQLENRRDALLTQQGFPKGRCGVEAWLASRANLDAARDCWIELQKLAAQARDDNEINGRLIDLLLKQNREALSVLLSGGAESIYGADGQQRSLGVGKRSLGAG